jgi:large subunit ribosomal protein L21
MYAVIKAGGKQQRVKPGDVIEVELMHGNPDDTLTFSPLLVVDDDGKAHVGKDLGKAVVKAKMVGEHKGDKVKVFKYRPKSGYARHQGHRQMYTLVEIQDVTLGARRAAAKKAEEAPAVETSTAAETAPVEETPAPEETATPAAAAPAKARAKATAPKPDPRVHKTPSAKPDPRVHDEPAAEPDADAEPATEPDADATAGRD